jgi:hypothetical protein
VGEIEERLRADLRTTGDFRRIHPMPQSGADVPDDMEARLVVLGPDQLTPLPWVLAAGGRRCSTITLKDYKQFLAISS